jgi:hypothetical protein
MQFSLPRDAARQLSLPELGNITLVDAVTRASNAYSMRIPCIPISRPYRICHADAQHVYMCGPSGPSRAIGRNRVEPVAEKKTMRTACGLDVHAGAGLGGGTLRPVSTAAAARAPFALARWTEN